ncbi:MAG: hypothetical protein KA297_00490 [Kofleriaceae bacterium]|nr:hypothetical protein [Kofleriaceae bacterium]
MKKKGHHKKKKGHRNKRRNDSGGGAAIAARSRPRFRIPRRGAPPPWHTLGAAVAGAVGSAVASGLLVNQKVAEPETVSMLMAVGGGVAAYLTDGNARVAATGVACAGAGQYALAKLGKAALRKAEREQHAQAAAPQAPAPAAVPPAAPPRQRSQGGGVVLELFRDAAAELESDEEDEWRFGTRDSDVANDNDDTPIEIDLDEAA